MWLYVPSAYVPESVALISDSESLPTPAPSATSNGVTSPQPLSRRGSKTAAWMTLLSGMTLPALTASLGVDRWISSQRDSPASQSVLPDSVKACPTSDLSGPTLSASSMKWSQGTSFLRTCQESYLPTTDGSSTGSYPAWSPSGSIVNGTYSARKKRVPRTAGNDGFALASPWATPTVQDGKNNAGPSQLGRNSNPLNVEVVLWATPRAEHDSGKHRGNEDTLHSQTKQWPSPRATDHNTSRSGEGYGPNLPEVARHWPTPNTSNATGAGSHGTGGDNLQTVASTHQPATTTTPGNESLPMLNPRFAEWLMGWPMGWTHPCSSIDQTAFAQWETASCRLLSRLPGLSSIVEWECEALT